MSDFAEHKDDTKSWQPFASAMAASVVYNMFEHRLVLNNWPNYKPDDEEGIVKYNFEIILSSNFRIIWNYFKYNLNTSLNFRLLAIPTTSRNDTKTVQPDEVTIITNKF